MGPLLSFLVTKFIVINFSYRRCVKIFYLVVKLYSIKIRLLHLICLTFSLKPHWQSKAACSSSHRPQAQLQMISYSKLIWNFKIGLVAQTSFVLLLKNMLLHVLVLFKVWIGWKGDVKKELRGLAGRWDTSAYRRCEFLVK